MQQMKTYFYPNTVTVQCNPDPTITARWRTMYQRQIKIYKGVDNIIQFIFKNSDQKPVNVTGWDITFNMISDREGMLVVSKLATVVNALAGIVTVSLTEFDLIDLDLPYYNYALTVTDPTTGIEQVVYTDENFESRGEILLRDGPYPEFQPSIIVDLPSNSNSSVTTSGVVADTNAMQQSSHHTSQFFFSNFSGNLTIQGTLDSLAWVNNTAPNLSWGNISSLMYVNQTATDYYNWSGIYTAVRFVVSPTDGNVNPSPVTQILYRA